MQMSHLECAYTRPRRTDCGSPQMQLDCGLDAEHEIKLGSSSGGAALCLLGIVALG
jgi:hypothetical protein